MIKEEKEATTEASFKPQSGVTVLSEEMVGYLGLLWTISKARKETQCRVTGLRINRGDKAWRPQGNGANRFYRISELGMLRLREGKS